MPQSEFEKVPKVVRLIEEAERLDPSPGPYRVHRMPIWNPVRWKEAASGDRVLDFVRWELDTIQPKYGLLQGVEYTYTLGVAELYDYSWFFAPFPRTVKGEAARMLHLPPGDQVVVYPRRGFDLWNSRYFVLPGFPIWNDADRGFASFLPQTRQIYPPPDAFSSEKDDEKAKEWMIAEDFQVVRNLDAFPRAWIVHEASLKPPIKAWAGPLVARRWRRSSSPTTPSGPTPTGSSTTPGGWPGSRSRTPPNCPATCRAARPRSATRSRSSPRSRAPSGWCSTPSWPGPAW